MGVSSFFKNLFGTAKKTANEIVEQAETVVEETKIAAKPYVDKAEDFIEETVTKAKETATPYIEKTETFIEETIEKVKVATKPLLEKPEKITGDPKLDETKIVDSLKEKESPLANDSEEESIDPSK
jgi:polyhydroxyalkanoate synthesis regulator phasin